MSTTRATPKRARISLDRSIERLRKQLADLAAYLGRGLPTRSLEEFDQDTENLIAELLGDTSELLEAYDSASCNAVGCWKVALPNSKPDALPNRNSHKPAGRPSSVLRSPSICRPRSVACPRMPASRTLVRPWRNGNWARCC